MARTLNAIAALALGLWSCGREAPAKARPPAGAALYANQGCATCHGMDGAGTSFGPTLLGKKSFWTREKLASYLRDPAAYGEKDARLSEQARRFMLPMQRFDKLTADELSAITDYVLAL